MLEQAVGSVYLRTDRLSALAALDRIRTRRGPLPDDYDGAALIRDDRDR